MTKESEAQRRAREDREAGRNQRIYRGLRRSASYRTREEHKEWLEQHRPAPAKPDTEKS